ncbi:MAG: glycosyltransferase [Candidatus Omnitrophica bacterium]|nr:glycosyltransferase [Candidatus Omnitrophota bacterium]
MTESKIELSVVLPSYREEENLRNLLPRLLQTLGTLNVAWEVLVVDTLAQMDRTKEVCEQQGVRYVARRGGNYFGCAVRTGIDEARGDFVLFMDADGSHSPEFIPELFEFRNDFDVVIASRYVENGQTENSFSLVLMSRILNWTYSVLLDLPCKDVSNSFKLYRSAPLKSLKLNCNNFDIVEEVLFKLRREIPALRIKEVPFFFRKRLFGETKRNLVVFIVTYIFTIIKLRLKP